MLPNASDPEPGSVIAQEPIFSIVSSSRPQRFFCSRVPFDITAAPVSPMLTPIAVTMPGQKRDSSISDAIYGSLSENALAFGLLLANLVFFVGLGWALVRRRRDGWLYPLLLSSGAVLLFCAVGLGAKAGLFRDGPRAIALDDRIVLREGPDPRARERGEARGGDRAEVIARDGDFVKLRVVNGLEGWTPASGVGLIDLGHGVH